MQIWVDADACPVVIRDILYRAADRTSTQVTLVASQFIQPAKSRFVKSIQVPKGVDSADNEIVKRCEAGDLVITSDIPLSDEAIEKGCLVLSPRGEVLTKENIKGRLNMRDFLDTLRSSGIQTGGPASLNATDRQNFGNALDRWLAQKSQTQRQVKP